MAVHDWSLVEAGIFHAFHTGWVATIQNALNDGKLPGNYYALAEQHTGHAIADVLTLHVGPNGDELVFKSTRPEGGIAVAESPPRTRRKQTVGETTFARQRSLAIRHVSGHHLVAILEIVSPGNKDGAQHVEDFVKKALSFLYHGVHLVIVDLLPPSPNDPQGMHGAMLRRLDDPDVPYDLPADEPLTLASYAAGPRIDAYIEHAAVGAELPPMPLFLSQDRYVHVPLAETYQSAYAGMPAFWKNVLESRSSA